MKESAHRSNAELLLEYVEDELVVGHGLVLLECVEVDEVGPVAMDDGRDGQAVLERHAHVVDAHPVVEGHLPLQPVQQRIRVDLGICELYSFGVNSLFFLLISFIQLFVYTLKVFYEQ